MRVECEAQLLASLNHPHIAQIYGFEVSDTTSALVMERVEGPPLPIELRRDRFRIAGVVALLGGAIAIVHSAVGAAR